MKELEKKQTWLFYFSIFLKTVIIYLSCFFQFLRIVIVNPVNHPDNRLGPGPLSNTSPPTSDLNLP
jgi:hypothetical protein